MTEGFKVVCVGRGNIGKTFAGAWRSAGVSVQLREGRGTFARLKPADVIILAVPDRAIEQVAEALAADRKSVV